MRNLLCHKEAQIQKQVLSTDYADYADQGILLSFWCFFVANTICGWRRLRCGLDRRLPSARRRLDHTLRAPSYTEGANTLRVGRDDARYVRRGARRSRFARVRRQRTARR